MGSRAYFPVASGDDFAPGAGLPDVFLQVAEGGDVGGFRLLRVGVLLDGLLRVVSVVLLPFLSRARRFPTLP